MGQDKAFMQLGAVPCWRMPCDLAMAATGSVQIVGSAEKFAAFGPVIEDYLSGTGTPGWNSCGAGRHRTELNLIMAVDMPFLEPELLNYLFAQARRTSAMVVVPAAAEACSPSVRFTAGILRKLRNGRCAQEKTRSTACSPKSRPG